MKISEVATPQRSCWASKLKKSFNEKIWITNFSLVIATILLLIYIGKEINMPVLFDNTKSIPSKTWKHHLSFNNWVLRILDPQPTDTVSIDYNVRDSINSTIPSREAILKNYGDPFEPYNYWENIPLAVRKELWNTPEKITYFEENYDMIKNIINRFFRQNPEAYGTVIQTLGQNIFESWRWKDNSIHTANNNSFGIKRKETWWVEWVDFYYASDDSPTDKFKIFPTPAAGADTYLKKYMNWPIYTQWFEQLTEQEKQSILIMTSMTHRAVNTYENWVIKNVGYATDPNYDKKIFKLILKMYKAFWVESPHHIFGAYYGEKINRAEELKGFPWFSKSTERVQYDFIKYVQQIWYVLPNWNRIFCIPHDSQKTLENYHQKHEEVVQKHKEQLIANIWSYRPTREQRIKYNETAKMYEEVEYQTVTIEQCRHRIRESHEPWYQPSKTVYMLEFEDTTYPWFSFATATNKISRDRNLWALWKRWIAVHGTGTGSIHDEYAEVTTDLAALNDIVNKTYGYGNREKDTYGMIITRWWLCIQVAPPSAHHWALNNSHLQALHWLWFNDLILAVEMVLAADPSSPTAMEPRSKSQVYAWPRLIDYLRYRHNTDNVISSKDPIISRFALLREWWYPVTHKWHTDDLNASQRQLLDMPSTQQILEQYYTDPSAQALPRVDAMYNAYLSNPLKHNKRIEEKELEKRYGDMSYMSKTISSTPNHRRLLIKKHGIPLAWKRKSWELIFPYDHFVEGEDSWLSKVQVWDELIFERQSLWEGIFN